jgi:hypothetical protein
VNNSAIFMLCAPEFRSTVDSEFIFMDLFGTEYILP